MCVGCIEFTKRKEKKKLDMTVFVSLFLVQFQFGFVLPLSELSDKYKE